METHDTYHDILQAIDNNTTVLTPNRRLSAHLHQQYRNQQQQPCWLTPDILPLTSWLQRLWHDSVSAEFTKTPLLLSGTQEQFLWEKIIATAKESDQLLQIAETANTAKAAWVLLKQWNIDIKQPIFNSAEDYMALQRWASDFEQQCIENNWIDAATLPTILIEKIKTGHIIAPKHIVLVGFNEITPIIKKLLSICTDQGSQITEVLLNNNIAHSRRLCLLDAEDEVQTIARWAKSLLAQHPGAKIGCVIPTLDKMRDRVMQVFSEVFAENDTYTIASNKSPFNLSAGKNFLQYPVIHAALALLALHKNTLTLENLSYLLASPFIGDAENERIKRYMFDSSLRQANISNVSLSTLLQSSTAKNELSLTHDAPQLAKRIQKFLNLVNENAQSQPYHHWATLFSKWLNVLGWPGERSLSSEEYQVVEHWLTLLHEYASLDQLSEPVNIHQALKTLHRVVAKSVFQPKSPEAPIQVLGILEAAALPFDYLWITGMDDISWPPQPHPNPFIPKKLQRELQMPHATPERELFFCQSILKQFKASTTHLIFSHAAKLAVLELQASPLIRDIPEISLEDLALGHYKPASERIYMSRKLELINDNDAPALIADEKVYGGVNVIKQQATCPFKAFAQWRLHAHALEAPLPGLRAKDRGTVLHKILEIIWNQLGDQAALMAMTETDLSALIQTSIHTALMTLAHSHKQHKNYMALESQRLFKLVREWLQIEKERPPFSVLRNEGATKITLDQLNLSMRIDRVDTLGDGTKLIIDYKSGKNNEINNWFGDRPEEPQLPLYALLDFAQTTGIAYAQLCPGETGFKGISHYALDIQGIKLLTEVKKATALSWQEQFNQWKVILTKLGDDFRLGIANVDPKDGTQTCTWCELQSLCRINEEASL